MRDTVQPASVQDDAGAESVSAQAPGEERKRGFPAPVTILTFVLIVVWIAAFFVPSGEYEHDPTGSPVAGSFRNVAPPLDFKGRVEDLLLAPVNGMYASRIPRPDGWDPSTGEPCSARSRCFCLFSPSADS